MPTWTFVRHGQSVANREGWLAGHHDAPLTDEGEAEAVAARSILVHPLPQRAFCSDLARAHRTARLLLEGHAIPLVVTPLLRERSCGAWERRSLEALAAHAEYRPRMGTWAGKPPAGESLLDVALRVIGWLARIDDPARDTLVVAHGALMRAVLASLDRVPRERIDLGRPRNCEAIRREIPAGTWAELLDELRREAMPTRRAPTRSRA
jgi:broad specificity phosphatase PhoE